MNCTLRKLITTGLHAKNWPVENLWTKGKKLWLRALKCSVMCKPGLNLQRSMNTRSKQWVWRTCPGKQPTFTSHPGMRLRLIGPVSVSQPYTHMERGHFSLIWWLSQGKHYGDQYLEANRRIQEADGGTSRQARDCINSARYPFRSFPFTVHLLFHAQCQFNTPALPSPILLLPHSLSLFLFLSSVSFFSNLFFLTFLLIDCPTECRLG